MRIAPLLLLIEDLQKINGPTTAAQVLDPEYRTANFLFYAWSSLDFGAGVIEPHNIKEMRIFRPGTATSIWKVKM